MKCYKMDSKKYIYLSYTLLGKFLQFCKRNVANESKILKHFCNNIQISHYIIAHTTQEMNNLTQVLNVRLLENGKVEFNLKEYVAKELTYEQRTSLDLADIAILQRLIQVVSIKLYSVVWTTLCCGLE